MKNHQNQQRILEGEIAELRKIVTDFKVRESQWKKIEQELKEKEEQYREIFNSTTDGLLIISGYRKWLKIVEVNPEACRMYGYSHDEFLKLRGTDIVHPDYYDVADHIGEIKESTGEVQGELGNIRKDGTLFFVEVRGTEVTYHGKKHMLTIVRDITHRRKAEQELQEKEAQYRSIFEAATDALLICSENRRFVEVNPQACTMYGYSYREMLCLSPKDVIHPDYHRVFDARVDSDGREEEMRRVPAQSRSIRKDGSVIDVEVRGTDFEYKGTKHWLTIVRDITERKSIETKLLKAHDELELRVQERTRELQETATRLAEEIDERKQAESAVRERESQYRGIFDAVSDGLLIIDLKGFIVEANPEACTMHGYTYKELTSLNVTDLVHLDYHEQGEYFSARIRQKKDAQAESLHVRKDGTSLRVDSKAVQFKYRGARHILCIFRDITVQKEAEEALRESERALRLLSSKLLTVQENEKARIARELHDSFGQTLTAIKFGVEHAVQQMETDSTYQASKTLSAVIPMIQHAVEEIRKVSMELRPTMLDNLGIVSTIRWFVQEFKKVHPQIRTRMEIPIQEDHVSKPLKLTLYRILQEATNNIAKHSDATFLRVSLKEGKKGIQFIVKDNGKGFDVKKTLAIESPPKGLGIPSMTERTRQSGGVLTIDSLQGAGTVVRALWPDEPGRGLE